MNLEIAIRIALDAHDGQIDKAGQPYILHPLRVMLSVAGDAERIVAALHDVIEDNASLALDDLAWTGFSNEVLDAVAALTRRADESYEDYILRCRENPIARVVKIADLTDNMDETRLPVLAEGDRERLAKYEKSLTALA